MNKNLKKTLSVILTLLMIVTMMPFTLPAKAAGIPVGETLYLKPGSLWSQGEARFAAYLFNNTDYSNCWVDLDPVAENDGYYQLTVPEGIWDGFLFCRMVPGTANGWENCWNNTGDLFYDGVNNLYSIDEDSDAWYGIGMWNKWSPGEVNSVTLYLVNVGGLETPCCYYWGPFAGVTFPGTEMTLYGNDGQYDIYTIDIPVDGLKGFLFVDKDYSDQTPDIRPETLITGTIFDTNGKVLTDYCIGHEWENGICNICKKVCAHTETDETARCTVCGETSYAITKQPSENDLSVEVNFAEGTTYQWMKKGERQEKEITDKNAMGIGGSPTNTDVAAEYESGKGWMSAFSNGEYSPVVLINCKKGDVIRIPAEGSVTKAYVSDSLIVGRDPLDMLEYETAQADGSVYFEIENDGEYLIVVDIVRGETFRAYITTDGDFEKLDGATESTYYAKEIGEYCCAVRFADGTEVITDKAAVTYVHVCDFSGEWQYDIEKHWKKCSCGEIAEEAAHTYTDSKCECGYACFHPEQTGNTCEYCGSALHVCDFSGEWNYSDENHWKECECGETEEVAHVYTDGVCDVCGYECLHENWTDGTCDACGYDCEHAFDTDANIMTALTCERCGYTYESDKRWAEGVYETYYNGLVAMLNSYYYDDDEIVAYFALDTVDGEESSISFDWAINQGFTEYGEFSLHFYHNGKEVITHDFSSTANPYDNILSEEYKFTAEGEIQIFKFVFKKDDFGYWYDDGRTAYLNIKDHSHVFGEATCIAKAVCETCGEEYGDIDADNHKDTLVQVDAKAPTCTEIGWDAYEYCTACDYTTKVEIPVNPDAHAYNNGVCGCGYECPHEDITVYGWDCCYTCGYIAAEEILLNTPHTVTERHFVKFTPEVNGSYYLRSYDTTDGADPEGYVYEGNIFNYLDYIGNNNNFLYGNPAYNEITYEAELTAGKTYYFELFEYRKTQNSEPFEYTVMIKKICDNGAHSFTDSICDVCGYECFHPVATEGVCDNCGSACTHNKQDKVITVRPVQNDDGTWEKGTAEITCLVCGNTETKEVERDHEGYKTFDETAAKLEALINSDELIDSPKSSFTGSLNSLKNSAYSQVYTEIEGAIPSMTDGLNSIIATIEAGLADGTMKKADWTYMTAILDEIKALIDNDPNKIIPSMVGYYYGPNSFYSGSFGNPNYPQSDYDRVMAEYGFKNQLETLLAGLKDGSALKADYTEIDEAIAEIEQKLADENVTDEAKADLEEIKSQLEEMKQNPISSEADLAELEKALEDYEAELDAGIEDGSAVKVDGLGELGACIAPIEQAIKEKYGEKPYQEILNSMSDEDEAERRAILSEAMSLTGSLKDNEDKLAELKGRMEALLAKIENCLNGTHNVLKFEVTEEAKCGENAIESATCTLCGETVTREVENSALTHSFTKYEVTEEAKCGVEGKEVAYCDNGCGETDEKAIAALRHSFTKYEVTEEAKCGVEGKEVAYCDNGCGETDEKAIATLRHSFTKYEVTEEAKCGVEGKEVAYCDNGCGETDEKAIEALTHSFIDYIYNDDATCEANGTMTAVCANGCGETDTVEAEDTMLDHADEDGDGICDDCETEIKDVCPDCGGPVHEEASISEYICLIMTIIKLFVSLINTISAAF